MYADAEFIRHFFLSRHTQIRRALRGSRCSLEARRREICSRHTTSTPSILCDLEELSGSSIPRKSGRRGQGRPSVSETGGPWTGWSWRRRPRGGSGASSPTPQSGRTSPADAHGPSECQPSSPGLLCSQRPRSNQHKLRHRRVRPLPSRLDVPEVSCRCWAQDFRLRNIFFSLAAVPRAPR